MPLERPDTRCRASHSADISYEGVFARAAAFLGSLGFTIRVAPCTGGFLDEVEIAGGDLLVLRDTDDLAGELLHEAGHLAVLPERFRSKAAGDLDGIFRAMSDWFDVEVPLLGPDHPQVRAALQCGECEAVAWSYAAAVAIGIDTRIPFARGFDGEGLTLHDQVASGRYFGVHGLAAGGMTDLPHWSSATPFPMMKRWLQI
jgi:hypothetical protein